MCTYLYLVVSRQNTFISMYIYNYDLLMYVNPDITCI